MLIRPQELQPGDVIAILRVATWPGIRYRPFFCKDVERLNVRLHAGVILTKQNNEITFISDCSNLCKESIAIRGKLKVLVLNR